jgi:tetratricopeptide (TPR) repeat protein
MPWRDDIDTPARRRARLLYERGRHLFNIDQFDKALAAFREAINADGDFLPARCGKVYTFVMTNRAAAALAEADRVIARDASFAPAHTARASALHRLGRLAEALAAHRLAVKLAPEESVVHYNFACFWAAEGNESECKRHLNRAITLNPPAATKARVEADFAPYREKPWFKKLGRGGEPATAADGGHSN